MPGGTETTEITPSFDPTASTARGQLGGILGQQFGGGGVFAGGLGLQGGANPLQQQANNALIQFLRQPSPEQQAFDLATPSLQNILSGTQDLVGTINPLFQQNLGDAFSQLQAQAPGRFSSAFAQQGTDIAGRALNQFNVLGAGLAQQQQQSQIQAAQALGLLGQSAGAGPFARALGAGQLGTQQGQFGQQLQLQQQLGLLGLLGGLGQPTGMTRTVQQPFGGGFFGDIFRDLIGAGASAGGASLGGI